MATWRRRLKVTWRWTKRIGVGIGAFVIFAVCVVIGLLHTHWGREKVRKEIVAQLQADFPGTSIGSLDGSIFGTLVAHDVVLGAPDGKPLATVKTLAIDVALRPIVGKTVRVQSILADGVVVYARSIPAKPEPPKPPTPSTPSEPSSWTIDLPSIRVANARVEIATATGAERLDGISLAGAVSLKAGVLTGSVATQATWRGQPVTASAALRMDKEIEVPFANVTLGGATIIASSVTVHDPLAVDGNLVVRAPGELAKTLAEVDLAGLGLPGDLVLAGTSRGGAVELRGSLGTARTTVLGSLDLEKLGGSALVIAEAPQFARGTVVAAIAGSADGADGLVSAVGEREGAHASTLVAVSATPDVAHASGLAAIDSPYGHADANFVADGALSPEPNLVASGSIDGKRLHYDDIRLGGAVVRFDATGLPGRPVIASRIEAKGLRRGELVVPSATLAATATLDETIGIDLGAHRILAADGRVLAGSGGTVTITDGSIAVSGFRTGTAGSELTADALISRTTEDLSGSVTAKNIALSMLDPTYRGTVAARLSVARTSGAWSGGGTVDARGVQLPEKPSVDGHVALKLANRRVTVDGTATSTVGTVAFGADVTGPRDITDPDAWRRLQRSAITRARVALTGIDAHAAAPTLTGTLDGELSLSSNDAQGELHVRGIETEAGTISGDITFDGGAGGTIITHATAAVADLPPATVDATIALPAHPFDVLAWEQLRADALREATVTGELAVDPALLAKLGVDAKISGHAATRLTVGAGARTADLAIDVTGVAGEGLFAPVDLHATAHVDGRGVTGGAKIASGGVAIELAAMTPLTIDTVLDGRVKTAAIDASVTIPQVGARTLLALLGRHDVLSGTASGSAKITGTVGRPELHLQLAAADVALSSATSAKKPPKLEKLSLDARWASGNGEVELIGYEAGGRMLKIAGHGDVKSLETIVASIEAANFDIAPIVAFAPGALGAARGTIDAALTIKGLDPQRGDVRGMLHLKDGRMALSPELGNIRKTDINVTVIKQKVTATLDARLGSGSIKGTAAAQLAGGMPMSAKLALTLSKISPIGAVQPVIDAQVDGSFQHVDKVWTGKLAITKSSVYVPPEGGNDLLGAGAPGDMIFIDSQPIVTKKGRKPPSHPWLYVDIELDTTPVVVEDPNFTFRGSARGALRLTYGDGMALEGAITTETGAVDILGRRYLFDHGVIDFDDGTLDPRLDMRLAHDFKSLTLTVDVLGRSSDPDVRLSGDPGTYTESQLLAFLAGAEPGDDPNNAASSAAINGGAALGSSALLATRYGRAINKYLQYIPGGLKLDTLSYEAATTSSSRAVRFGLRWGERSYLLVRRRIDARPDENREEALFEYQLAPWALIETTAGQRGGGADLLLRTRW